MPTEQEIEELGKKYNLRQPKVGSTQKVRVVETRDQFYVVKSIESEKKSKTFIGVVPKCMAASVMEDVLEALVLENLQDQLPLLSCQPQLI